MNSNTIKIIMLFFMTLDHALPIIKPSYHYIIHFLSRYVLAAFSIFSFDGLRYTSSKKKYLIRLFISGISTFFLSLFLNRIFYINNFQFFIDLKDNMFLVLFLSNLFLYILFFYNEKINTIVKYSLLFSIFILLINFNGGTVTLALMILHYLRFYKKKNFFILTFILSLLIRFFSFYIFKSYNNQYVFIMSLIDSFVYLASLGVYIIYNGKRGKYNLKYLFYVYYPLHLWILTIIFNLI